MYFSIIDTNTHSHTYTKWLFQKKAFSNLSQKCVLLVLYESVCKSNRKHDYSISIDLSFWQLQKKKKKCLFVCEPDHMTHVAQTALLQAKELHSAPSWWMFNSKQCVLNINTHTQTYESERVIISNMSSFASGVSKACVDLTVQVQRKLQVFLWLLVVSHRASHHLPERSNRHHLLSNMLICRRSCRY